ELAVARPYVTVYLDTVRHRHVLGRHDHETARLAQRSAPDVEEPPAPLALHGGADKHDPRQAFVARRFHDLAHLDPERDDVHAVGGNAVAEHGIGSPAGVRHDRARGVEHAALP